MNKNDIVVLIPAYNPTEDLILLTDNLLSNNYKVVIVNDGSKEETNYIFDKLDKDNVIFIEHEFNKGKGQALKTGFKYILENIKCKGVITADADGQHLVSDIINISNSLCENSKSLILGSRTLDKSMPFRSKFGNSITRLVFKLATKVRVYDTQTGLRGIPFELLEKFVEIDGQRYEYEINMLLYSAKNKIRIEEIPIKTVYIDNNKTSSFHAIKDSFQIYKCIFKNSDIKTSILFGISAIISFLIDFILLLVLNKILLPLLEENIALLLSVIGARAVSSLFNFTFNRNVVFNNHSSIIKALSQYYLLAISVLIVNYLLLNLLTIQLSLNLTLSKILVEIFLFINNYIIQKIFIFKKNT